MATPASQVSDTSNGRNRPSVPQLSCELCRKRKIKCDKSSPCSNCVKSDVACVPVYRKRLPRGRHVNPRSSTALSGSDELRDRIRRLEALVSTMGGPPDFPAANTYSKPESVTPVGPEATDSLGTEKHVGRQFWARIVEEIGDLRDIVGSPSDDEESVMSNSKLTLSTGLRVLGIGAAFNDGLSVDDSLLGNTKLTAQLCQVYLDQVDPIIKVLHRPSLSKFMLGGQRYLGYEPGHISTTCLSSAVCYSALASMTEEQCQATFGMDRRTLMIEYREACESELERSELLTTSDITILQAFILFLVARRTEDPSRTVWTMFAVAFRIAKSLSLHLDRPESFFNQQIRQRLWCTICVLDLQLSFEQATEPLIEPSAVPSTLPMNIDDSEFDVDTQGELKSRGGLTDMTFALVIYNAQRSGRLLNFCAKDTDNFNWEEREEHVSRYEQKVHRLLRFCDPESSSYAWWAFHGAQTRVAAMRLSALRPLHRVGNKSTSQTQRTGLLHIALEVLEKIHLVRSDPRGEGFRWYEIVQWHALAIAITECFVCTDVGILRAAWPVVETAFEEHRTIIESYRRGMLRRPLERLMEQTRKRTAHLLQGQSYSELSSLSNTGLAVPCDEDLSSYHTHTKSSNAMAAEMNCPDSNGLIPAQQQPQQYIATFPFDIEGTNPAMPFDDPGTTSSSATPWFMPHMPYNQSSQTDNIFEPNSDVAGDISWRTWEEFVSGLPFEDYSHAAI
ncbi:hypothetical protein F5Y13DRAFT_177688 [Hypoxylon sp. FL1857]|nr:hypothetical protein F5Y13DRAFT_177688 [Hypoxylon sp. FL1857]